MSRIEHCVFDVKFRVIVTRTFWTSCQNYMIYKLRDYGPDIPRLEHQSLPYDILSYAPKPCTYQPISFKLGVMVRSIGSLGSLKYSPS